MQVNIQRVERDLWRIKQIDSRLYNNEDTQHVIQELGSKYTNEQQQLGSSSMLIITNCTTS